MRLVPLNDLIQETWRTPGGNAVRGRLLRSHISAHKQPMALRASYIDDNGRRQWSSMKPFLAKAPYDKCWYTEVKLVGADLTIDHYRPRRDYWWLAFEPENYRIACPLSNSLKHNANFGCAGGKGDEFPLLSRGVRARRKRDIRGEVAAILDPCCESDCLLLAFQPDGRPVLSPEYANDPVAAQRVEMSKILLNLDHPDLNSKREQLYHAIAEDMEIYFDAAMGSRTQEVVRKKMKGRVSPDAEFSVAARYYLGAYRYLTWVNDLIRT